MLRGTRYNWDEHNEGHIAAHRVESTEIEEVLENDPVHIETRMDAQSGEERVLELGHTNAGRVLFVVWTPRAGLVRPVTAFDANRKTRTAYQRRRDEKRNEEKEQQ